MIWKNLNRLWFLRLKKNWAHFFSTHSLFFSSLFWWSSETKKKFETEIKKKRSKQTITMKRKVLRRNFQIKQKQISNLDKSWYILNIVHGGGREKWWNISTFFSLHFILNKFQIKNRFSNLSFKIRSESIIFFFFEKKLIHSLLIMEKVEQKKKKSKQSLETIFVKITY